MNAIQISYEEAREKMRPGDVIAFGGKGNTSDIIKFATLSNISHVAVILQTKVVNDSTDRFFNEIIPIGKPPALPGDSQSLTVPGI